MNEITVVYFRNKMPQTVILSGNRVGYEFDQPCPGMVKVWANKETEERTLILNSGEVATIDMTITKEW